MSLEWREGGAVELSGVGLVERVEASEGRGGRQLQRRGQGAEGVLAAHESALEVQVERVVHAARLGERDDGGGRSKAYSERSERSERS